MDESAPWEWDGTNLDQNDLELLFSDEEASEMDVTDDEGGGGFPLTHIGGSAAAAAAAAGPSDPSVSWEHKELQRRQLVPARVVRGVAFAPCPPTLDYVPPTVSREQRAIKIPVAICDLANTGDSEGIERLVNSNFSPNTLFKTLAQTEPIRGRHNITQFFQALMDIYPDMIFVHRKTNVDRTGNIVFHIDASGTRVPERSINNGAEMTESGGGGGDEDDSKWNWGSEEADIFGPLLDSFKPYTEMARMMVGGARRLFFPKDHKRKQQQKQLEQKLGPDASPSASSKVHSAASAAAAAASSSGRLSGSNEKAEVLPVATMNVQFVGKLGFAKAGQRNDDGLINKADIKWIIVNVRTSSLPLEEGHKRPRSIGFGLGSGSASVAAPAAGAASTSGSGSGSGKRSSFFPFGR